MPEFESKLNEKSQIILKPINQPRADWNKAFKLMSKNGDDKLLMDDVFKDEKHN